MNQESEQIALDKSLVVAQDQPLNAKELRAHLMSVLDSRKCRILMYSKQKWILEYTISKDKVLHILVRTCTYLGNPHPIYKKRVQLPLWFNEYAREVNKKKQNIDVRYIGVYHYADKVHGDNVIFIDFKKDTYLAKKGHNSSAHVYTNDLLQGMTYGVFTKQDKHGNTISVIRKDKFHNYLSGMNTGHTLFDLFRQFNSGFLFGQWIKALRAIKEMHENGWQQWRQAEWAGWFLEYNFNKFTIDNNTFNQMHYVGNLLKREGDLDFDVKFEEENFYGDLKASDISKKETPGNDQDNLINCIYSYDKFWYIIYEHETIKDDEQTNYEATKQRNRYIQSVDAAYKKDEMSYHARMKSAVRFIKMSIIELNRVNFREALKVFNQGHQPGGQKRKPKFNIDKRVLNNDNFVVFRYTYRE